MERLVELHLNELKESERKVLVARLGLDGKGEKSLHEVGALLGISAERVRQIESKAKRKLARFNR